MQASDHEYQMALQSLSEDGIIAYPTEAVYGFGCSPFSEKAVEKLLALKDRPVYKGLILIAASFTQLEPLLEELPADRMAAVLATWPGPVSWAWPMNSRVPAYIHGDFDTVVVRVTAHPVARQLCEDFGGPLVSTSANRSGETPCRNYDEVFARFDHELDYILPGDVGDLKNPTPIYDATTGKLLRA